MYIRTVPVENFRFYRIQHVVTHVHCTCASNNTVYVHVIFGIGYHFNMLTPELEMYFWNIFFF